MAERLNYRQHEGYGHIRTLGEVAPRTLNGEMLDLHAEGAGGLEVPGILDRGRVSVS